MSKNYYDNDIEILDWGEDENETQVVDSLESTAYKKKKKKKEKIDFKKEFLSWAWLLVVAVVVAFLIDRFLIVNANVPSGSMENTIMAHTRMVGWRWSYSFGGEPERGDIIIFKFPDDERKNFVKRVIGLPGERVKIEDGIVYINDEPLQEDYAVFKDKNDNFVKRDDSGDFLEMEVPKDSYFVLGDNRNDSEDSRYWITTNFVPEKNILGKAIFTYWHNGIEFKALS